VGYPFDAGLHCQSVLADRFTQSTRKSFSFLWATLRVPSAAEREGTSSDVLIFLGISLLTPFRFATII